MRLALIISTTYEDNPKLEPHRAAPLDAAIMAERLMNADADFIVERLDADRDLPERLESLLERYPGNVEALAVYFSGYVAVSAERGPALLLSGSRLKAFPLSRVASMLTHASSNALCVLDAGVMTQGSRWPKDIAKELAEAIADVDHGLSAMVSVRLLGTARAAGPSRFTDLLDIVLEWLASNDYGQISAARVFEAMKQERASFAQVSASFHVEAHIPFPFVSGTAPAPDYAVAAPDAQLAPEPEPSELDREPAAPQRHNVPRPPPQVAYMASAPPRGEPPYAQVPSPKVSEPAAPAPEPSPAAEPRVPLVAPPAPVVAPSVPPVPVPPAPVAAPSVPPVPVPSAPVPAPPAPPQEPPAPSAGAPPPQPVEHPSAAAAPTPQEPPLDVAPPEPTPWRDAMGSESDEITDVTTRPAFTAEEPPSPGEAALPGVSENPPGAADAVVPTAPGDDLAPFAALSEREPAVPTKPQSELPPQAASPPVLPADSDASAQMDAPRRKLATLPGIYDEGVPGAPEALPPTPPDEASAVTPAPSQAVPLPQSVGAGTPATAEGSVRERFVGNEAAGAQSSSPPRAAGPVEQDEEDEPTPMPTASRSPQLSERPRAVAGASSAAPVAIYEQALQALSEEDLGRADIHIRLSHAARAEGKDDAVLEHLLRAHAIEPLDRKSFEELVGLLEAKQRFEEVTTLCRERLNNVYDDDETVALLDKLVAVWLEHRKDPAEALKTLEERLAFRADRRGLETLVKIHDALGDREGTVSALEELAATIEDPGERADLLIDAAHQAEAVLGDLQRAIRLAKKAYTIDPSNSMAFELAVSALRTLEDHEGLADLYELALEHEPIEDVAVRLINELMAVCRDHLKDPIRIARAARRALRLAPRRVDLRMTLAEAYESRGLLDDALDQARAAITLAPTSPNPYRIARRLMEGLGNKDGAYASACLTQWLDPNDAEAARYVDGVASAGLLVAERTLNDEDWELLTTEVHSSLLIALDAIYEAARTLLLRGRGRKPLVLDPELRHTPDSTATLARTVHWAGQLLRIPMPAVYIMPELDEPLAIPQTEEPSLLLGRSLATGHSLPELAFLTGRHLALFRREFYLLGLYGNAQDLAEPLRYALVLAADLPVPAEADRATAKAFQRLLTDQDLEQLREATDLLEVDLQALLEEWTVAVLRTATRAGVLACGHPHIAGDILERYPLYGPLDLKEQQETVALFSMSDQYTELRRRLGVVLSPPTGTDESTK